MADSPPVTAAILDGKATAAAILDELHGRVAALRERGVEVEVASAERGDGAEIAPDRAT